MGLRLSWAKMLFDVDGIGVEIQVGRWTVLGFVLRSEISTTNQKLHSSIGLGLGDMDK